MSSIVIIGAGLSGLTVARSLKEKGHETLILEKSKGLGGRVATRRIEDLGFDHGASFFHDSQQSRELIKGQKLICESYKTSGIFLRGGMNQLPKSLATGLKILKDHRVESLRKLGADWELRTENNQTFNAEKVILTAPLPQALELLEKSQIGYDKNLGKVTYHKSLLALVIMKPSGSFSSLPPELTSILAMRERDLHPDGFVVRASYDFSEKHFDAPEPDILKMLTSLIERAWTIPPQLTHIELKKWRYSQPVFSLPVPYVQLQQSLFLIGDAFISGDSTGAVSSALSLAKKLT
ncbi:MAG TPA: FAD-dependent oxidoreductase [Bacteriovoracaceae bacterium]|nr:FAD-dependent oxidoreductase [Bacteriovoracaceae bacterium]